MRLRILFTVAFVTLGLFIQAQADARAAGCVPDLAFVSDVSVPDGTTFALGAAFEKAWRVKNTGACAWQPGYVLAFVAGDPLGAWTALSESVPPGSTADVAVKMLAPQKAGNYEGLWQMRDLDGKAFGQKVAVRIKVVTPAAGGINAPSPAPAGTVVAAPPTGPRPTASLTATQAAPPAAPTPDKPVLAGKIAFAVLNTTYQPKAAYDLYVIDADGTGRHLIAQGMRQPDMRPDGMILAKGEGLPGQDTLYAMNLDGSNKRQISPYGTDERPSWAPGGDSFVFSNRQDGSVVVQDALLRDARRNSLGYQIQTLRGKHAAWLPDGRIVYQGCNVWGSSGSCGLYVTDRKGSLPAALTSDPSDLSPDVYENKVVFMSHRDGNWEIYRVDAGGGAVTRLTNDPANDSLPAWSPFGHQIVFVSDRGGAWAVWAMEIDGSRPHKLFDLNGPMGEDWIEQRISWNAWPQDVAPPPPPTAAPGSSTTPSAAAVVTTTKSLDFTDAFTDTTSGLPNKPMDACGGYYEGGQYHLKFKKDDCNRNYALATYDSNYRYFMLDASVGRLAGEGEYLGSGEVIFGYKDEANYYGLSIGRMGRRFRFYRIDHGAWKDLTPWAEGGSLAEMRADSDPPAWDRVRLVVKGLAQGGTQIEAYGGGFLGRVRDQSYDGGAVGFAVRAGGFGHAAFADFGIRPIQ